MTQDLKDGLVSPDFVGDEIDHAGAVSADDAANVLGGLDV
jgi:hypothetical protein